MVYLSSDYHIMGTGILSFRQVEVTIVVAENDTPIRLQIERSNPTILAPQLLWLSLNGNGDPDLPSGRGNYRCGGEWHTDPASDQKIEPYNLSTTTPLDINWDTDLVDLAKKANPYLCNKEHKQEQERKQPNYRWMINLMMLGSHKPMNDETVLDRLF